MRSASQQVMPLKVNNSIWLEIGAVAAGYECEVDVLVLSGITNGVFDGSGKLVLQLGVGGGDFDSIESERQSSSADKHGFACMREWEALDAVDHGDGKFESGVEGGGGEKLGHVDVGPQVSEVVGDNNGAVADRPGVVL